VEKPDAIKVNSSESLIVAKTFESIVKQSGISPYEKNSNSGYWRLLVVRESKTTKQMLVSVVVSLGELSMSTETKIQLMAQLGSGTRIGEKTIVSLTLIQSSDLSGGYKEGDSMEVLSGKDSYEEVLCGLKFNVSPFAFFQVNTLVFEKMIAQISEFAGIDKETTLFDICCGTGAIGLCLS
jgi:tRNA (uracil-5-)-methyltransferase